MGRRFRKARRPAPSDRQAIYCPRNRSRDVRLSSGYPLNTRAVKGSG